MVVNKNIQEYQDGGLERAGEEDVVVALAEAK